MVHGPLAMQGRLNGPTVYTGEYIACLYMIHSIHKHKYVQSQSENSNYIYNCTREDSCRNYKKIVKVGLVGYTEEYYKKISARLKHKYCAMNNN